MEGIEDKRINFHAFSSIYFRHFHVISVKDKFYIHIYNQYSIVYGCAATATYTLQFMVVLLRMKQYTLWLYCNGFSTLYVCTATDDTVQFMVVRLPMIQYRLWLYCYGYSTVYGCTDTDYTVQFTVVLLQIQYSLWLYCN